MKGEALKSECFTFNYNSHGEITCAVPHLKQSQRIVMPLKKQPSPDQLGF